MEKEVTVIARFRVKPEMTARFIEMVNKLVENTRREEGCFIYDYHRDLQDPTLFFSHELWKNAAALANHFEQSYIKEALAIAPELLSEPVTINSLAMVSEKA